MPVPPILCGRFRPCSLNPKRQMNPIDYLRDELMIPIITFFHGALPFHNWGLAIVLLTLTVKFLLFPLNAKQFRSMRIMQKLQPRLKAMQEQYRDKKNPEQMREFQSQMMALYKEHNITPLSGCLPLLIQLPILIALYYTLTAPVIVDAIHMGPAAQSAFIFIQNLLSFGAHETYLHGPLPSPGTYQLIHWDNIVLIVLYTASSYFTQKMMTTNPNDPMQKQMLLMSLLLGPMFGLVMPSGVLLYIVVSSAFTIVQYQVLHRQFPTKNEVNLVSPPVTAAANPTLPPLSMPISTSRTTTKEAPNSSFGLNEDGPQISRAARRRASRRQRR